VCIGVAATCSPLITNVLLMCKEAAQRLNSPLGGRSSNLK
jgi:hypothetical protein